MRVISTRKSTMFEKTGFFVFGVIFASLSLMLFKVEPLLAVILSVFLMAFWWTLFFVFLGG